MSDCMTMEDAMKMDGKRAIEILEPMQKMMCDQHGCPISDAYFALGKAIEALEAQHWIPCSEKLPEEEQDVLVTRTFLGCKDYSHGWNNHIPPKKYVEVAQRIGDDWCALSDEYKVARSRHTDPIAWMPLPGPWEGESEDKE